MTMTTNVVKINSLLTPVLLLIIWGIFELAECLSIAALGLVNNTVLIYDCANNAILGSFLGFTGSETQIRFLKNGYLAAQTTGTLMSVVNVFTKTSVYTYPSEIVSSEELNNGYLAVSSYDHTVKIIHLESQTLVGTLKTNDYQTALKQTAIGNYLAGGSYKGLVRIWDTDSFTLVRTLVHSTMPVRYFEVMGDGFLASYAYDNSIKLWNILTGACLSTYFVSGTLAGMKLISSDVLLVAFGLKIQLLKMNANFQLCQNYSFTAPSGHSINKFSVTESNMMILAVEMGKVGLFNLTSFNYAWTQVVPANMNTYIYSIDVTDPLRVPIASISTNR
jgi:WD40 repeat protein